MKSKYKRRNQIALSQAGWRVRQTKKIMSPPERVRTRLNAYRLANITRASISTIVTGPKYRLSASKLIPVEKIPPSIPH
jgi:hypothetical protein